MYTRKITPLRSCVGKALPVKSVKMVGLSPRANGFEYLIERLNQLNDAEQLDFNAFLPHHISLGGDSFAMTQGSAIYHLPNPENLPFAADQNGACLLGLLPSTESINSRDLWIEIEIKLEQKYNLGGLSFSGFPYLMYSVNNQGENSANFGLPREIRIKWKDDQSAFLDDENVFIRQEPVSHSGIHYITFGPVVTDHLIIRFADWPELITLISQAKGETVKDIDPKTKNQEKEVKSKGKPADFEKEKKENEEEKKQGIEETDKNEEEYKDDPWNELCNPAIQSHFGLIIPWMVVYEYEESSIYRAHLPVGLLACIKEPPLNVQAKFCPYPNSVYTSQKGNWNADYLYFFQSPEKNYASFGAASAIDQRRK